jgi:pimeloyl-ACP methyl ester carboxylesterase
MQCYQAVVRAREETITVRNVSHRVLHWGDNGAPLVFLLHGFQDCSDTFQFLVDALPRDYHFVAPDWRGFGGSGRNDSPYWFQDYLADLEGILDHYSESAATLVGHSMGGHIASLYAGVRPSRVRRVVSLEGFGLPRVDASIAPDRLGQWLDEISKGVRETLYDSSERLARMLQHRNSRLTDERAAFIAKSWTSPVSEGGVMLRFDPWHRLVNPVLYRREEAEACWRRIVAPTLVLLAGESEYRKRLGTHDGSEELERFKTCFAHLEVHDFPALGHMMHHEDPVGVAAVLSDWLHRWR